MCLGGFILDFKDRDETNFTSKSDFFSNKYSMFLNILILKLEIWNALMAEPLRAFLFALAHICGKILWLLIYLQEH